MKPPELFEEYLKKLVKDGITELNLDSMRQKKQIKLDNKRKDLKDSFLENISELSKRYK